MLSQDWDRSHEWVIERWWKKRAVVTIKFRGEGPSAAELYALRRCLPEFQHVAPMAVRNSIGNVSRFEMAELEEREARQVAETLARAGFSLDVVVRSVVHHLPIDRTMQVAWLIEDWAPDRDEMIRQMIAEGVPIVDVES